MKVTVEIEDIGDPVTLMTILEEIHQSVWNWLSSGGYKADDGLNIYGNKYFVLIEKDGK